MSRTRRIITTALITAAAFAGIGGTVVASTGTALAAAPATHYVTAKPLTHYVT